MRLGRRPEEETMLLLGTGHCFRDQVLEVCPELSRFATGTRASRDLRGSSLETIRHMVASGLGVTVLPMTSIPQKVPRDSLLAYCLSSPRRLIDAWCWPGARALPGRRRSRRCAGDPQMPAARRQQARSAGRAIVIAIAPWETAIGRRGGWADRLPFERKGPGEPMAKKKVQAVCRDGAGDRHGIDAKDREKVADALSRLLADTYALYLKTHNSTGTSKGRCSTRCT